jgi:IS30 family transposase
MVIQKNRRAKLGSLGKPPHRREVQRAFWRLVALGWQNPAAAAAVGVSHPAGWMWFRDAGGMSPLDLKEPSGRYLSFVGREEIAVLRSQKVGVREIARRLGRAPSTISRELEGNAATRGGRNVYRASTAQWHCERRSRRPKVGKLAANSRSREYVQAKLGGDDRGAGLAVPDRGRRVANPVGGRSRRRGRDVMGRWDGRWSPEQIARRLVTDFPDDETMRISHEAIYQALYVQGRGALRRELTECLRTGRAIRKPRRRAAVRGQRQIPPEIMISQRPAEVGDRALPGHWEGDLIVGAGSSAIGTLVERKTRFVMLLHLPRMAQYAQPRVEGEGSRGWAGHGAEAVREAITATMTTLPEQLPRSLTWDQGTEMAQHARLRIDADLQVYFCDPHSPWQRGSNENTNGPLRQYFPKGTDLSVHSPADRTAVAAVLNGRPRKTLHWKTPAETMDEELMLAATLQ